MESFLQFNNPNLLWLLLLIPIIAFLKGKLGTSASIVYSSVNLAKNVSRKSKSSVGVFLLSLRYLSLAFLIIALARPQKGTIYKEVEQSGIDILLVLDISGSMAALDFTKNVQNIQTRLDVVKDVMANFIEQRVSDRIGIVAFGTEPRLVSPLTLNHAWLLDSLNKIELGDIEGNTAIGDAIGMSVNSMRQLKDAKSRIVVLLTDGENNAGSLNPITAAMAANRFDIKIYTIAAGNSGEVPIAMVNRQTGALQRTKSGDVMPQKDIFGNLIKFNSTVDEETLKEIAKITGGKFFNAKNTNELWQIYDDINQLEKTKVNLREFSQYEELFYIFALISLLLLAIEMILTKTIFRRIP